MKLVICFTIVACLQVSAKGYSQTLNLFLKNAPLEKAFEQIERQSRYRFAYTQEEIERSVAVTINVKNAELKTVLEECFKEQPLSYKIEDNHIVVHLKEENKVASPLHEVKGRVTNAAGDAVAGVTITVKESKEIAVTGKNGEFSFDDLRDLDILVISGAEIESQEIKINKRNFISITVVAKVNELDQVLVMAYGETSKRLSTGSISKVSSEEISRQPVSNPLAALQGRVPGLIVTQSNGVPGSTIKIQIRGRNSIAQGSDPLFVIDGVPFTAGIDHLNQLPSALGVPFDNSFRGGGLSPFTLINPDDIESIEILKDAEATSIYGSRGANGVILITTKKGQAGRTKINVDINSGISKVSRTMPFLSTQEYVRMRREAFANDNIIPNTNAGTSGYAPDILIWDTTRHTDLKDMLTGNNARYSEMQASVSGGNQNTQFLLGSSYRHQTTVYPGDFADDQGSFHLNLRNTSANRKFNLLFTGNYSSDNNHLLASDLSAYLYLPATIPALLDSLGKLRWEEGGESFFNPLSPTLQKYSVKSENLISNLQLQYKIVSDLEVKVSLGYNDTRSDESSFIPRSSIDPLLSGKASSSFANNHSKGWIVEPIIEYSRKIKKGKLNVLVGSTWQDVDKRTSVTFGENYTSDALLESITAAGTITARNSMVQYRYQAFFGRLNYNWSNKYILSLSGRRDGSSRFGKGRQYANFGAAGVSWIFSSEPFFKKLSSWISFAKLRTTYGTAGNDQIGDYQYLDSWSSTSASASGNTGIYPVRLNNPDYGWEINRKFEASLDLGFLQDKILFSVAWYRNRSSNQLINYSLPIQTGFNAVNRNFDATVENKGWEFTLTTKNINSAKFKWSTDFNLTAAKNRLVSFPGLASSSYAYTYKEGYPLSLIQAYRFLGVDPQSGIYTFDDIDKDGTLSLPNDAVVVGNLDPKFYGGINNSVRFKNIEFSIFLEFRKQTGRNYLFGQASFIPGKPYNQPNIVNNRWQNPGDITGIQKFTAGFGNAYVASINLSSSAALFGDASYISGKNLSLAYYFKGLTKLKIESLKAYIVAQNLFIITNYEGSHPETQNMYALPPLQTISFGIQVNL